MKQLLAVILFAVMTTAAFAQTVKVGEKEQSQITKPETPTPAAQQQAPAVPGSGAKVGAAATTPKVVPAANKVTLSEQDQLKVYKLKSDAQDQHVELLNMQNTAQTKIQEQATKTQTAYQNLEQVMKEMSRQYGCKSTIDQNLTCTK